jgi:WD40 repeat protein
LSAGFEKRISLFDINTVYLDTSLKGELLGH